MDIFYIIVLSIATILLILLLTYIGIKMKASKLSGGPYPPIKNSCPDYWTINDKGKCVQPGVNGRNRGKDALNDTNTKGYDKNKNAVDFNDKGWTSGGSSSMCAQQKWANTNGILWDGVTNYNGCK